MLFSLDSDFLQSAYGQQDMSLCKKPNQQKNHQISLAKRVLRVPSSCYFSPLFSKGKKFCPVQKDLWDALALKLYFLSFLHKVCFNSIFLFLTCFKIELFDSDM